MVATLMYTLLLVLLLIAKRFNADIQRNKTHRKKVECSENSSQQNHNKVFT